MKTTTTLKNLWVAVAVLAMHTVACGGGGGKAQVKGKVTDGSGTQGQELGVRAMQLGGSGSVAATTKVRASTVGAGGALTTVAEANVQAQGSYTLEVPEGEQRLVIQALDASGQVRASALLDAVGEADATTVAPPMDSESTLEAEVYAQMVADGTSAQNVDTVDVRARINTQMAAAASQGASSGDAFRARVKAMAEAVRAAQQSKLEMYSRAGVQTSQDKLFQGELAASAALNVALDSGRASAEAYQTFLAGLATAAEQQGAKAEQQAQGERAAGASFRATLEARLSTQDAQPLVDAAARGSASLEARASGAALQALVSTQQAATAASTLRAQVSAAATAQATANAFAAFQASVATNANLQTTVLGNYLQVSSTNQIALSAAVQASVAAAVTLDAALDAAATAAVTTGGTNVSLLATKTADAYQAYATAVRAQASALSAVFPGKGATTVEVLIVAEGSFQSSP